MSNIAFIFNYDSSRMNESFTTINLLPALYYTF